MKFIISLLVLISSSAVAAEYTNVVNEYQPNPLAHSYMGYEEITKEEKPHVPEFEVIVNRSTYMMDVVEDGAIIEKKRVIVGRKGRSTPLIETQFSHIELNPVWDVPKSLADDMVRKFKSKEKPLAYIKRNGYYFISSEDGTEIPASAIDWINISSQGPYDFKIKQKPGPLNMLGRVMFVLKDTRGVQMHGTANPELFEREVRRFSSGCIRVDKADDLAAMLLNKPADEYEKYLNQIGNKWIKLPTPVKVKVVE